MTSKEMEVFQAALKEVKELQREKNEVYCDMDTLEVELMATKIKSRRRHRELRRLNSRIADLSTAKRLEDKFERFIRDILDRHNRDKEEATIKESEQSWGNVQKEIRTRRISGVTEPQPIATGEPANIVSQYKKTVQPDSILTVTEPPVTTRIDKGRAIWRTPVDVIHPAAHVKHTDGVCETCGYNPCRCSKEF